MTEGRRAMGKAGVLAVALMLTGGLFGAVGAETAPPRLEALGDGALRPPGLGGYFEPNMGQFPDHVRFVVHGAGMHAFLTEAGATFVLQEPVPVPDTAAGLQADALDDVLLDHLLDLPPPEPAPASLFTVQLRFEDADPGVMVGTEKRQGISSHFIGSDPDKWVTDVPHYGRVIQRDVWPGIDVQWHITQEGLKFDAVVHPGADPRQVSFTLPGADALQFSDAGDLVIGTPLGSLVKEAPYTYQETTKGPLEVPSRYTLSGGIVGFEVGDHDPSKTLVIDPLVYSTYFDGQEGRAITSDAQGHAYVAGRGNDQPFPEAPGRTYGPAGGVSVFVFKLTPAGDEVVFSVRLGGNGLDDARDIALDLDGNVYITGVSRGGHNFPTTQNALQPDAPRGGRWDGYVTKLRPDGGALLYSTYLGGRDGDDTPVAIAVDDEGGMAYVTGGTASSNWQGFPTTIGSVQPNYQGGTSTGESVFLVKLNTTAAGEDSLVYGTYFGGYAGPGQGAGDWGRGVAVDAEGYAYVAGSANSMTIPTTFNSFQPSARGFNTGWAAKFTPDGDGVVYSTYLGGPITRIGDIAIDGAGHAYLIGVTTDDDFHTSANTATEFESYRANKISRFEVFLTKLTPDGDALVYSTFVAPTDSVVATSSVAVDGQGQVFVAGRTHTSDFETKNAFQEDRRGATDAFVAAFQPDGADLIWGTYFGGTGSDAALAMALDPSGSAYITGRAESTDLPTRNALQPDKPVPEPTQPPHVGFVARLYGVMPAFEWSPVRPCPGDLVHFRDLSVSLSGATGTGQSIVRSQWGFGDSSAPHVFDPWQNRITHAYLGDGNYSVILTVVDDLGSSASLTRVVEVPWCPPPNHAPVLKKMPCIIASPEQRLSFHVHASVPILVGDPPSYSNLSFFAEGLPSGATFQQDGGFAARFMWEVGPPGTYIFVVHVEDGGLPEHDVPSLRDSGEYCVEVRPEKPAPGRDDASGDGVQNWHDACPHMKSPDQGGAAGDGLDDPCDPEDAPPEPEETPEEQGPPPGGCPSQPAGPREVTARWTDGAVQVTWQSDSWCPPDHFLVWNGTGHHLVDFVVAEAGVHYVVLNLDPWPEPHQYYVQAMGAEEGLFFDPTRAVASNLIDPAGCVAEGARSEACLPPGIGEEPPAAVEPAGPEAAAPADGAPVGLIAAAVALVVGGLMALLWRLRHAPWVVHLFTRLGRDDVLEHPVRKEIAALVSSEPGIHYAEILRRTGKSSGAVQHHLGVLASAGLVHRRKTTGYVCYYPAGDPGPPMQAMGTLLRADVAKRLLRLLIDEPGLPVAELGSRLHADPATIRYHLHRFEKGELAKLEDGDMTRAYPGSLSRDALASLAH